nr:universal stress protein PHOS34-like isoform X1 [Ipomoea batatas]
MQQNQANSSVDSDLPRLANIKVRASSPRFPPPTTPSSTETPTAGAQRRIGIAVDLSDESAFAVKWAVHQYLRPGDARRKTNQSTTMHMMIAKVSESLHVSL